jgi:quercetin dioxygenase-like cupin family protein
MDNASLTMLTQEHLALAQVASSGRSAHTVYGGHEHHLRQTLIALAEGRTLNEHENPGEATLQVLVGRVRLVAGDLECVGAAGDFIVVPGARHHLDAEEDSVVLLTTSVATAE